MTLDGVFRFDREQNRAIPVAGIKRYVREIAQIGRDTWFFGADGVLRLDRQTDSAIPIPGIKRPREDPQGNVFVHTNMGDAIAQTLPRPTVDPLDIPRLVLVGNEIWVENRDGVFRFDAQQDRAVPVAELPPNSLEGEQRQGMLPAVDIWLIGNDTYFVRSEGWFRFDREHNRAVPFSTAIAGLGSVLSISDGEALINTPNGVFQWRDDWSVSVDLAPSRPWLPRPAGYAIWLAGITSVSARYPSDTGCPNRVNVLLAVSSEELSEKESDKNRNHWSDVTELAYELKPRFGITELHVSLKDSWGNEIHDRVVRGLVVPLWGTVTALLPVVLTLLWMVCLGLAPYVRSCHLLLMNPYARRYASFGVVPLLLTTFPPARRHLLRRYRLGVSNDPGLKKAAKAYIVPDESLRGTRFLADLSSHRTVLLYGQSGIGKSAFLQYLVHHCSADIKKDSPIAVLVDLSVYGGMGAKERMPVNS